MKTNIQKKILLFLGLIGMLCFSGCESARDYMPTEEETLEKVSRSVPVEYELVDVIYRDDKDNPLTTYYFECTDRPMSFTAESYAYRDSAVGLPIPDAFMPFRSVISVSYWSQLLDMYYKDIRELFVGTPFMTHELDGDSYKSMSIVLHNDEEKEMFIDRVLQGDDILKQELEYADPEDISVDFRVHYNVSISYTLTMNDGSLQEYTSSCCEVESDTTLEREALEEFVTNAIEETIQECIEDIENPVTVHYN